MQGYLVEPCIDLRESIELYGRSVSSRQISNPNYEGGPNRINLGRMVNRPVSPLGLRIQRTAFSRNLPEQTVTTRWARRYFYFSRLFENIRYVQGNVVVCGVVAGYTTLIFAALTSSPWPERNVFGYDSLEGLPEPVTQDRGPESIARKEALSATTSMAEILISNGTGVQVGRGITLTPGWFEDTLPNHDGQVAFLFLDADMYESTLVALEALWDKMPLGGIVGLDEYKMKDLTGETKAVDEFSESMFNDGSAELKQDEFMPWRYHIIKSRGTWIA